MRRAAQGSKFTVYLKYGGIIHGDAASPFQISGLVDAFQIQVIAVSASHPIRSAVGNDRTIAANHQQMGDVRLGGRFDQQLLKLKIAAVPTAHTHSRTGLERSDQGRSFFHQQADTVLFLAVDVDNGHQGDNGQ